MERPWGLSGPEFLELYWIALAVSLAIAIVVRVRLRGSRGGVPAGVLGLYEVAFLTGGARRVVETSVAALISAGALRPARDGAVRVVGSPTSDNPVDRAVLADAIRYRNRTLTLLINTVSEHDAPRAVGDRLVEQGYLASREQQRASLRLAVVPMALLLVVGLVRWVNGLAIGAPVGWLSLQLVLTGVLIALLLKANKVKRTARGREAVAQARAGEGTGGWGVAGAGEAASLVALHGFNAHPDVPLRAAARPRPHRSRARDNSGTAFVATGFGTTSCSSGSSCSGGSSCGGGGGCGGGGS